MIDLFKDFWELALLGLTWGGILFMALRRRREWHHNRFTDLVNFSLNLVDQQPDGTISLRLRTLLEESAANVWLNPYGVHQVQRSAAVTSRDEPFLRFASSQQATAISRAVLNVLSEQCAAAFVADAIRGEVTRNDFLFGITWERYGEIHAQKLRVMVIRPCDLELLFGAESVSEKKLQLEQESHRPRLKTLAEMHRLVHSSDPNERLMITTVELATVTS